MSHKLRSPVNHFAYVKILTVGEDIDEGKFVKTALSELISVDNQLIVVTDSKDFYSSLSAQRMRPPVSHLHEPNDRRSLGSSRCGLHSFQVRNTLRRLYCCKSGLHNLYNHCTKRDSALAKGFQLLVFTRKIPIDL